MLQLFKHPIVKLLAISQLITIITIFIYNIFIAFYFNDFRELYSLFISYDFLSIFLICVFILQIPSLLVIIFLKIIAKYANKNIIFINILNSIIFGFLVTLGFLFVLKVITNGRSVNNVTDFFYRYYIYYIPVITHFLIFGFFTIKVYELRAAT